MSDTKELVERLRSIPLYEGYGEESDLPDEAADALEAFAAKLEKAKAALEPFAKFAEKANRFVEARANNGGSPIMPVNDFRLIDFKRAREALEAINAS